MTALTFAGMIVGVTVAAWGLFFASARGMVSAGESSGNAEQLPWRRSAADDASGVTRRQFLNRAYVAAVLVGLSNFSLASLDYVWPRNTGGLGGKVTLGDANQLRGQLEKTRTPLPFSEGILPPGIYLMTYEGTPAAASKIPAYVSANVAQSGFVALFRRCVHLGCTVPFCDTSKWLECPCHGSKYSINGEYRAGPAPRSLDRFRVEIKDGKVVVDTSTLITGPPRGTVTSQPQAEGVHCVNISGA